MRKLAFLLVFPVVALVAAAVPAGASVTPTERIQAHDVTQVSTGPNPCTGSIVTTTETFHWVWHEFLDPNGDIHGTINTNGTLTSVPADPAGLTFTGTFHSSNNYSGPPFAPGGEVTYVLTVNGHYSDGTHGTVFQLFHITINANLDETGYINAATCGS